MKKILLIMLVVFPAFLKAQTNVYQFNTSYQLGKYTIEFGATGYSEWDSYYWSGTHAEGWWIIYNMDNDMQITIWDKYSPNGLVITGGNDYGDCYTDVNSVPYNDFFIEFTDLSTNQSFYVEVYDTSWGGWLMDEASY